MNITNSNVLDTDANIGHQRWSFSSYSNSIINSSDSEGEDDFSNDLIDTSNSKYLL